MLEWASARCERGRHLPPFQRIPYDPNEARRVLAPFEMVVLCGAREPIAFFNNRDFPSRVVGAETTIFETEAAPAGCRVWLSKARIAAAALSRDHRLDAGSGDFLADSIGIIAAIGQEYRDLVLDHPEQRCRALHMVRLARRQHEAERESSGVVPCVKLGRESPSRLAKRPCLLSPLRRAAIASLVADVGLEEVKRAIDRLTKSTFIREKAHGSTRRLDWLIEPKNFEKVIAGSYDDEKPEWERILDAMSEGAGSL